MSSLLFASHCWWFRQILSGVKMLQDDDRCCHMASIICSENVSRVESLTEKDPKPTYTETWDIMKMSSGILTRILNGCLAGGKRCAR